MDYNQILFIVSGMVVGAVGSYINRRWRTPRERIVDTAEALDKQGRSLNEAFARIEKLESEVRRGQKDRQVLWSYLLEILESHIKHTKALPPIPPRELESDPELTEIFAGIKRRRKRKS